LYTNKLGNLDESNTFLEEHKLPKLTQEEIQNLNRSITIKDIELVILKNFTQGKACRMTSL